MTYVLTITGTRNGRADFEKHADAIVDEYGPPRLVVLGCDMNNGFISSRGVDEQAYKWALQRGYAWRREWANWDKGHSAGPKRNTAMSKHGGPGDVCLALPDEQSKGTYDCARKCEKRGQEVRYR